MCYSISWLSLLVTLLRIGERISNELTLSISRSSARIARTEAVSCHAAGSVSAFLRNGLLEGRVVTGRPSITFRRRHLLAVRPPRKDAVQTGERTSIFRLLETVSGNGHPRRSAVLKLLGQDDRARRLRVGRFAVRHVPFRFFLTRLRSNSVLEGYFRLFERVLHVRCLLRVEVDGGSVTLSQRES